MSRVTSKLQVTIPKRIAEQYGIEPGTEVVFEPAGDVIRLRPERGERERKETERSLAWKLALFDESTKRQEERNRRYAEMGGTQVDDRGWTREELYGDRGAPR